MQITIFSSESHGLIVNEGKLCLYFNVTIGQGSLGRNEVVYVHVLASIVALRSQFHVLNEAIDKLLISQLRSLVASFNFGSYVLESIGPAIN